MKSCVARCQHAGVDEGEDPGARSAAASQSRARLIVAVPLVPPSTTIGTAVHAGVVGLHAEVAEAGDDVHVQVDQTGGRHDRYTSTTRAEGCAAARSGPIARILPSPVATSVTSSNPEAGRRRARPRGRGRRSRSRSGCSRGPSSGLLHRWLHRKPVDRVFTAPRNTTPQRGASAGTAQRSWVTSATGVSSGESSVSRTPGCAPRPAQLGDRRSRPVERQLELGREVERQLLGVLALDDDAGPPASRSWKSAYGWSGRSRS